MPNIIELRSDTFTKPTRAMRDAIACADVGDDMVGEDPTTNRLEKVVAELLGKESAVFNLSGTQSNQMAIWTHCRQGDEILIEATSHVANYEAGAPAALTGATLRKIPGDQGRLLLAHLQDQHKPESILLPVPTMLSLENTTNAGGGRTYTLKQLEESTAWARSHKIIPHLDGARLFNACAAGGYSPAEVARYFDTISICFSKGLGCPMGSILVGSAAQMKRARRARKVFGGALRQAGMVAAACLYALEHHVERLPEDHRNAKIFAELISHFDGVQINAESVETNLVFFEIAASYGTAAQISAELKKRGVHINPAGGPQRMRACTHLDVDEVQIRQAAEILGQILTQSRQNGQRE